MTGRPARRAAAAAARARRPPSCPHPGADQRHGAAGRQAERLEAHLPGERVREGALRIARLARATSASRTPRTAGARRGSRGDRHLGLDRPGRGGGEQRCQVFLPSALPRPSPRPRPPSPPREATTTTSSPLDSLRVHGHGGHGLGQAAGVRRAQGARPDLAERADAGFGWISSRDSTVVPLPGALDALSARRAESMGRRRQQDWQLPTDCRCLSSSARAGRGANCCRSDGAMASCRS